MELQLTWIALAASLLMALGGACMFIFAVRKDYFRDVEEAKFHMFWADLEEPGEPARGQNTEEGNGRGNPR